MVRNGNVTMPFDMVTKILSKWVKLSVSALANL